MSNVLVDYARITERVSTLGDDEDGILKRMDSRFARIEKQMGLLINKLEG